MCGFNNGELVLGEYMMYKFGEIIHEKEKEFRYDDIYSIEENESFKRLVIAPKGGHIDLMLKMAKELKEPFGVLYVLTVPRIDTEAGGRYQSPQPLTYEELNDFCSEYREYFEPDGRHMLWIAAIEINELMVYDKHNVIYYYGDLEKAIKSLKDKEFKNQEVVFPYPHSHRYNQENDMVQERILKHWKWIKTPLRDEDDY